MVKKEVVFRLPVKCLRNILNLIRGHFLIFGQSMKHSLLLPAYRKCSSKIWATQNVRSPSIAKRTTCTCMKKVLYAFVFNSRGEIVQVPFPHSKTVTGKLYGRLDMKTFDKYMKKSRLRLCLQSYTLSHANVPPHISKGTLTFLVK